MFYSRTETNHRRSTRVVRGNDSRDPTPLSLVTQGKAVLWKPDAGDHRLQGLCMRAGPPGRWLGWDLEGRREFPASDHCSEGQLVFPNSSESTHHRPVGPSPKELFVKMNMLPVRCDRRAQGGYPWVLRTGVGTGSIYLCDRGLTEQLLWTRH